MKKRYWLILALGLIATLPLLDKVALNFTKTIRGIHDRLIGVPRPKI